jgi:hypothetical protein
LSFVLDTTQAALDVVGVVPGLGEVADGLNGLISLGRGDAIGAGLSFVSMIPIFGDIVGKGGKITRYAVKYSDEAVAAMRTLDNGSPKLWSQTIVSPTSHLAGRNAGAAFDLRGEGLIDPSSARFTRFASFVEKRYGAKVVFDEGVAFGKIDELSKTIRLNPSTASWDVLSHELSHARFASNAGKWGTGSRLTSFEVNLMEAVGYTQTYRKAIGMGMSPANALMEANIGGMFAQSAIQGIRSGASRVLSSLNRASDFYGRTYIEEALRFQGQTVLPRGGLSW